MQRTLLYGLILLVAPDGAAPRPAPPFCRPRLDGAAAEAPPAPDASLSAAPFQCPRVDTDGADARFCCGPCAFPSCCPSEEEARLHRDQCLLPETSTPPTPIWPKEEPGTVLANTTTANSTDGDPTSDGQPFAAADGQLAALKGGVNAAANNTEGSVQREHQLNGLYFCLGTLGLVALFYAIYYGVIGRKYPMTSNSEDSDYIGSRPPVFFINDPEGPAASFNEYIEMQDFARRPRRDSELSDRFNPFFGVRPPPPYDDDPPPPYSEHATFPLAKIDWMSGLSRRNNQCYGHGNMGYSEERGTRVRVGLPLSHPRRGSDPGTTMEKETEFTAAAAPESQVGGIALNAGEVLGSAAAAAASGPPPEVDGGGSVGAVVLPEGDGAAVASLAT